MDRTRWATGWGALGAVILVTTPLTYLFTAPSDWVTGAKLAIGILCVGVFIALRRGNGLRWGHPLRHAVFALVALALVIAGNVFAVRLPWRWDLTRERIHSLAPQTVEVLSHLPQPIEIVALVPAIHPAREPLEQLLREYQHASHGKLHYTLDDAHQNPALAARFGLREGEMAVVLERKDGARTALSAVSEAELTQALLRLSHRNDLKAYFLQGHGESAPLLDPPIALDRAPLTGLSHSLTQEGYRLERLFLDSVPEVPRDADVLLEIGPQAPLSAPEIERLGKYLEEGGHLVFLIEPNLSVGTEELLSRWGVIFDPGVVAEPPPPGVDSAYVLISAAYGEHPIARVLRQGNLSVQLVTARALTLLRQGLLENVEVQPIVFTGPAAWEESQADASPQASSGEKVGRLTLAAASHRAGAGLRSRDARLFVLGDADVVRDVLWGNEANRNLVLNAIAWAADPSEGAVAIRPVDRTHSSLALNVKALRRLRFVSVDLLPLALLAFALILRKRVRA